MTSIDFYTHVSDRFDVVAKLVAKAFAQHGSVRVLTADAESTETLDRMLWIQPAIR
jgi:DNA polymerase IIIc chi subunit